MSANSPIANPGQYTTKVDALSTEGITIDRGVAQAKRDAAEFVSKYSQDFSTIILLKESLEKFSDIWVGDLQQTRDAASSISGWYQRFDQVFLSMINDIGSEGDAKDVATEFNAFINEPYPTEKYNIDNAPGVKNVFVEIEKLATAESQHIIQTLQGAHDWQKAVAELKKNIPAIQNGIRSLRNSLNNYATKLE